MLTQDLAQFSAIPFSALASHDATCCVTSRLALLSAVDIGTVDTSLGAIPAVVKWQAVSWPVFWCQLESDNQGYGGDCGVHAALAALLLERYGIAFERAQIAISASRYHLEHWREQWNRAGVPAAWIGTQTVYHEVIAVGSRFWDPSEARWFTGVGAALLSGRVEACRTGGRDWLTTHDSDLGTHDAAWTSHGADRDARADVDQ